MIKLFRTFGDFVGLLDDGAVGDGEKLAFLFIDGECTMVVLGCIGVFGIYYYYDCNDGYT